MVTKPIREVIVDVVIGDYWEGVYVGGRLRLEGERVALHELLRLLSGKRILASKLVMADEEWLRARGKLPAKLSSVKVARQ